MMKRKFALLSLLVLLSGLSIAQKKEFKELQGLIRFGEPMLYISATELSNKEYNEYLAWLKVNSDSSTFKAALPDTLAWARVFKYTDALSNYYHDHQAYDDYPAVNISQEQARKFCEWKMERLMEYLRVEGSEIDSIIVRLPTEKEWMVAARLGLPEEAPYAWPEKGMRNTQRKKYQGMIRGNFKRGTYIGFTFPEKLNDNGFVTTPVMSYWPNPGGCWNMTGNVSEWINESGKSKGGSWNQGAYRCRIDQPGAFDGDSSANPEIGFRFMVEIVSLKRKEEIKPIDFDEIFYMSPLNDSVWMRYAELSNYEYQQFLLENTQDQYKIQDSLWLRYFPYAHYTQYGNQDKYLQYPVVNISYEAALAYCNWLTQKYSASVKPYKEVVFRLPTQSEWEFAASVGNRETLYPWGGPYTMNSKGCYLANFRPLEDQYFNTDSNGKGFFVYPDSNLDLSLGIDGCVIPGRVFSYFPNDYGYYNMAGNVAEMVAEKGISRGGSWRSNQEEIMIPAIGRYTGPDPTLGFRVVMEIVRK